MFLISLHVILFSQSKTNSSQFCNWYMIRSYLRPYNSNTQRALQFAISALLGRFEFDCTYILAEADTPENAFFIPFCSSNRPTIFKCNLQVVQLSFILCTYWLICFTIGFLSTETISWVRFASKITLVHRLCNWERWIKQ